MSELLNEETDPELAQFAESLPTLPPDTKQRLEEYLGWYKAVKPQEFIEYNEENSKKVSKMDPRYVATEHDTCEGGQISTGYHDFGPTPRCCWYTHGWHINKNPWDEDDYFDAMRHDVCMECNAGGDDDGDPDCETCEGDGWTQYYFDEYIPEENNE